MENLINYKKTKKKIFKQQQHPAIQQLIVSLNKNVQLDFHSVCVYHSFIINMHEQASIHFPINTNISIYPLLLYDRHYRLFPLFFHSTYLWKIFFSPLKYLNWALQRCNALRAWNVENRLFFALILLLLLEVNFHLSAMSTPLIHARRFGKEAFF